MLAIGAYLPNFVLTENVFFQKLKRDKISIGGYHIPLILRCHKFHILFFFFVPRLYLHVEAYFIKLCLVTVYWNKMKSDWIPQSYANATTMCV